MNRSFRGLIARTRRGLNPTRPPGAAPNPGNAHPKPRAMVNNPWVNRVTAVMLLLAVYAAGYAGGRDQAVQAYNSHPACNPNREP
jgi:hypothetical protein